MQANGQRGVQQVFFLWAKLHKLWKYAVENAHYLQKDASYLAPSAGLANNFGNLVTATDFKVVWCKIPEGGVVEPELFRKKCLFLQ